MSLTSQIKLLRHSISRRSAILGAGTSGLGVRMLLRPAGRVASGSISTDGSFILANTGGELRNAHGVWTFGPVFAPEPAWGLGPYCNVLLNGRLVQPGTDYPQFQVFQQKLAIDHGGYAYGLTGDQQWAIFSNYYWAGAGAEGFATPPPVPPVGTSPLPTPWAGPYTPSADGTVISGGTGTVRTREGDWTFGAAAGGGWELFLNGVQVGIWSASNYILQMRVDCNGYLFLQTVDDSSWRVWAGGQANFTSPSAFGLPIPVSMAFTPAISAAIPAGAPAGTFLTTVSVTMSNGSAFAGTLSVEPDWNGIVSATVVGMELRKSANPVPMTSLFRVTATQNGSNFRSWFDMQWSP